MTPEELDKLTDERRVALLLHRTKADAEHRARCPYDCVLSLEGTLMTHHWGRFSTVERAKEVGEAIMAEMRRPNGPRANYLPKGKRCLSYRVIDSRDGCTVVEPDRLAAKAA